MPQVATAEEAAPFASRLRRLLDDGAYLRRMSSVGRAAALAFAAGCEGGLARLLAERVRGAGRAREEGGGEATAGAAAANGVSLVEVPRSRGISGYLGASRGISALLGASRRISANVATKPQAEMIR